MYFFLPTYFVYSFLLAILIAKHLNSIRLKWEKESWWRKKKNIHHYRNEMFTIFSTSSSNSFFSISYLTDFFTPLAFTLNLFIFYRLYRHSFFSEPREKFKFRLREYFCFCGLLLHIFVCYMLLTYKFWMYENVIIFWWYFMKCNLYSFRLWKCKRLYFVNKVEKFYVWKSWAPYIMNYIDFKMLI